jgi:hypothetical protein
VTGRRLHDALLRVLTSGELRARLAAGDLVALAPRVGPAEAAILGASDPARLRGLARFLGRHFYRERIVRLFAASRRLAREAGTDPLRVLESPAFGTLLDHAELGSAETADAVASLVERELAGPLGGRAWGTAVSAYEGALFRVEAGPRRWRPAPAGPAAVRAPTARILALDWDVPPLVVAVRRGAATLPEPAPAPVRLLLALAPDGRVSAARCPDGLAALLAALDAPCTPAELAVRLNAGEAAIRGTLARLARMGAVDWQADAPAGTASAG